MKGVPLARAPFSASSSPGRTSGSASSSGKRKVMASVDPGANAATWRSVAAIASLVRYILTPVEATTAGCQPLPPVVARLEVDRNEPQPLRDAETELDQALSFPSLRTRPVDLEYPQARGDLRPALGERVQAGAEDDVLGDAAAGCFSDEVLDEAST